MKKDKMLEEIEGNLADRLNQVSRHVDDCLGEIGRYSRMAYQYLGMYGKEIFTREYLGVWNGLVQDVDTIVKNTSKARQRLLDMWSRTAVRRNNSPEGQKGSVCDE